MAKRPRKNRTLSRLLGAHPPSWVARRLGVKTSTVRRWQSAGASTRGARALAELAAKERAAKKPKTPRRRPRPPPAPRPRPPSRKPAPTPKRPSKPAGPRRPTPAPTPRRPTPPRKPKRPAPPPKPRRPRRPPEEQLTDEDRARVWGVPLDVYRRARDLARRARRSLREGDFEVARLELENQRLREIVDARRRGGTLPIVEDRPRLRGPVEGDDLLKTMLDIHDCLIAKKYTASFWTPPEPREDVREASVTMQIPTEGLGNHLDLVNEALDQAYDCTVKWLTIIPGTNTQLGIVPRFEEDTPGAFAEQYRRTNRKGTRSREPGVRELDHMQRRLHLLPNGMIGFERRSEGLIVPLRQFFEDVKDAMRNLLFNPDGAPKPGRRIKNIRFHLVRFRSTTRRPNVE